MPLFVGLSSQRQSYHSTTASAQSPFLVFKIGCYGQPYIDCCPPTSTAENIRKTRCNVHPRCMPETPVLLFLQYRNRDAAGMPLRQNDVVSHPARRRETWSHGARICVIMSVQDFIRGACPAYDNKPIRCLRVHCFRFVGQYWHYTPRLSVLTVFLVASKWSRSVKRHGYRGSYEYVHTVAAA